MKKVLVVIILVSIFISGSLAVEAEDMEVNVNETEKSKSSDQETKIKEEQEDEIEIDFDEDEFDEGFENKKFKGNGGPMMVGLVIDFSGLNEAITTIDYDDPNTGTNESDNFKKFSEDYMLLFGGGGLGGLKKGSRFGGYGAGGKLTNSNGKMKSVLEINYGGFLYEKGILNFEQTNTDIAVGALIGGGKAELDLIYKSVNDNFDNIVEQPRMNQFEKEFFLLEPRINIHQQLGAFIGLDISAGYLATYDFGENWKINDQVIDGPMSNFHCPSYGVRLSFGF